MSAIGTQIRVTPDGFSTSTRVVTSNVRHSFVTASRNRSQKNSLVCRKVRRFIRVFILREFFKKLTEKLSAHPHCEIIEQTVMSPSVYTIGHSTHPPERFMELLGQHGITALCDVQSNPYSRMNPQFNRQELKRSASANGIAYIFLGKQLGARSEVSPVTKRVRCNMIGLHKLPFLGGDQARDRGDENLQDCVGIAEREPLECHRTILVARELSALGLDVQHIHADGKLESHTAAMERLADMLNLPQINLFRQTENIFDEAYRQQGERIAYSAMRSVARGAAD